jgi:hypothetical protein
MMGGKVGMEDIDSALKELGGEFESIPQERHPQGVPKRAKTT